MSRKNDESLFFFFFLLLLLWLLEERETTNRAWPLPAPFNEIHFWIGIECFLFQQVIFGIKTFENNFSKKQKYKLQKNTHTKNSSSYWKRFSQKCWPLVVSRASFSNSNSNDSQRTFCNFRLQQSWCANSSLFKVFCMQCNKMNQRNICIVIVVMIE